MSTKPTAEQPPKDKPYFPLAGSASDGWSKENEATATCFCGAIQMVFPTEAPGLVDTFMCHCSDCRKLTASMFASNFTVLDSHIKFVRGEELITKFSQSKTVGSGKHMTNHFCSICGTLMNRNGGAFPGMSFMRTGTVDDFHLHETKLKPKVEQFTKYRVDWLSHDGVIPEARQSVGLGYDV
ncbi:histidine acid phosphatase [Phlyctema vagabunda]|uniref:Histidine acid phosphatase n=1 Tax=Phlyctema vagabunda TaxID=108571 RepID=A0ABR4P3T7_9HELO